MRSFSFEAAVSSFIDVAILLHHLLQSLPSLEHLSIIAGEIGSDIPILTTLFSCRCDNIDRESSCHDLRFLSQLKTLQVKAADCISGGFLWAQSLIEHATALQSLTLQQEARTADDPLPPMYLRLRRLSPRLEKLSLDGGHFNDCLSSLKDLTGNLRSLSVEWLPVGDVSNASVAPS